MSKPQPDHRWPRSRQLALLVLVIASVPTSAQNLLEDARHQPGARLLPSGLIFRLLSDGTGAQPGPGSTVVVDYSATSPQLGQFDSSYSRGHPLQIQLSRSPRCWQIGLQQLRAGGEAVLTCPPNLAYGSLGAGKIPPNEPLQFRIRLREVH